MTILSGKFFTFAGHENGVSYLNLQGAQYHRIESHLVQQKVTLLVTELSKNSLPDICRGVCPSL